MEPDCPSANLRHIFCRPNEGEHGRPVTNVRNFFKVTSEDSSVKSVRKLATWCSHSSILPEILIDSRTLLTERLLSWNTNNSSKREGYFSILSKNPRHPSPSLNWSSDTFVLPIAS